MEDPRTGSRWNQWLQTPGQVTFRGGDRVFEFSDDDSPTGLEAVRCSLSDSSAAIVPEHDRRCVQRGQIVDCLGWAYVVKFDDVFRRRTALSAGAPEQAIGVQCRPPASNLRRIRLTTHSPTDEWPDDTAAKRPRVKHYRRA